MNFTESKTLIYRYRFLTLEQRKEALNETRWEEWSKEIEHGSTPGRRPEEMKLASESISSVCLGVSPDRTKATILWSRELRWTYLISESFLNLQASHSENHTNILNHIWLLLRLLLKIHNETSLVYEN
ncbi:hypothetical protein YC2023_099328 [Brassica napus]